jgi:hypothetical protein
LSGQSLSQALHIANKLLHFFLWDDDDICPTDVTSGGRRARRWDPLPIQSEIQRAEAHAQRQNEKQVPLHKTVHYGSDVRLFKCCRRREQTLVLFTAGLSGVPLTFGPVGPDSWCRRLGAFVSRAPRTGLALATLRPGAHPENKEPASRRLC